MQDIAVAVAVAVVAAGAAVVVVVVAAVAGASPDKWHRLKNTMEAPSPAKHPYPSSLRCFEWDCDVSWSHQHTILTKLPSHVSHEG